MSIWLLLIIGALLTAFLHSKSKSDELKTRERLHRRMSPEINYEYNRFNTKKERSTTITSEGEFIRIETDVEKIIVIDNKLTLEIQSQLELYGLYLQISINPFNVEHLKNPQDSLEKKTAEMEIYGYGVHSAILIDQLNKLFDINLSMDFAAKMHKLKILSISTEKDTGTMKFYCIDGKNQEFDFWFDAKNNRISCLLNEGWLVNQETKKLR